MLMKKHNNTIKKRRGGNIVYNDNFKYHPLFYFYFFKFLKTHFLISSYFLIWLYFKEIIVIYLYFFPFIFYIINSYLHDVFIKI
jgi:hypothetical protein